MTLDRLLNALRNGDNVPDSVTVPVSLSVKLRELWEQSTNKLVEYGATLIQTHDGEITIGELVCGTRTSVCITTKAMKYKDVFGIVHTHVYESGITGVAFSEDEIAHIINYRIEISIVVSGKHLFLIGQSLKHWHGEVDATEFKEKFNEGYKHFLRNADVDWREALLRANAVMCCAHGLALYYGMEFKLKHVRGGVHSARWSI